MNKTKIDWADSTWNPVTGCLHDCEYCYARGIAKRFSDFDGSFQLGFRGERNVGTTYAPLFELDAPRERHVNGSVPKVLPYA